MEISRETGTDIEWGRDLPGYKKGRHHHGLRHTRSTDLSRRGMRAETIALLTGQDPDTIRAIYTHSDYDELLAGMSDGTCPKTEVSKAG